MSFSGYNKPEMSFRQIMERETRHKSKYSVDSVFLWSRLDRALGLLISGKAGKYSHQRSVHMLNCIDFIVNRINAFRYTNRCIRGSTACGLCLFSNFYLLSSLFAIPFTQKTQRLRVPRKTTRNNNKALSD